MDCIEWNVGEGKSTSWWLIMYSLHPRIFIKLSTWRYLTYSMLDWYTGLNDRTRLWRGQVKRESPKTIKRSQLDPQGNALGTRSSEKGTLVDTTEKRRRTFVLAKHHGLLPVTWDTLCFEGKCWEYSVEHVVGVSTSRRGIAEDTVETDSERGALSTWDEASECFRKRSGNSSYWGIFGAKTWIVYELGGWLLRYRYPIPCYWRYHLLLWSNRFTHYCNSILFMDINFSTGWRNIWKRGGNPVHIQEISYLLFRPMNTLQDSSSLFAQVSKLARKLHKREWKRRRR